MQFKFTQGFTEPPLKGADIGPDQSNSSDVLVPMLLRMFPVERDLGLTNIAQILSLEVKNFSDSKVVQCRSDIRGKLSH